MLTCGVDITEVERIKGALTRFGPRFLKHIYTPAEQAYCGDNVPEYAARFAAKEAISKALGTGIVGIRWVEMEILADSRGKPFVRLHGRAADRAAALGLTEWAVSLTHERTHAIAMVVAQ